jgi:acyl-homoserine lactone acylase PvdQ
VPVLARKPGALRNGAPFKDWPLPASLGMRGPTGDLSDPDANRLVVLGGQDGMPGRAAFLDQAELFRRGEYVELPLRPETARPRFPHSTRLEP